MDLERAARTREMLRDPVGFIEREFPEQVKKYETSGKIGRWFIRHRYPQVADRYDTI